MAYPGHPYLQSLPTLWLVRVPKLECCHDHFKAHDMHVEALHVPSAINLSFRHFIDPLYLSVQASRQSYVNWNPLNFHNEINCVVCGKKFRSCFCLESVTYCLCGCSSVNNVINNSGMSNWYYTIKAPKCQYCIILKPLYKGHCSMSPFLQL